MGRRCNVQVWDLRRSGGQRMTYHVHVHNKARANRVCRQIRRSAMHAQDTISHFLFKKQLGNVEYTE